MAERRRKPETNMDLLKRKQKMSDEETRKLKERMRKFKKSIDKARRLRGDRDA